MLTDGWVRAVKTLDSESCEYIDYRTLDLVFADDEQMVAVAAKPAAENLSWFGRQSWVGARPKGKRHEETRTILVAPGTSFTARRVGQGITTYVAATVLAVLPCDDGVRADIVRARVSTPSRAWSRSDPQSALPR